MRTGKPQKGRFTVEPGMAFRMKDLDELLPDGQECQAGRHPWLITRVDDNYIEMVMCRTLTNNAEGKHNLNVLDYENAEDIIKSCPPMDPSSVRQQAFCKDQFKIFPKKELFSHRLQILNENDEHRNFETEGHASLCMDSNTLKYIRKQCVAFSRNLDETIMDPFGIQDAEYELADMEEGSEKLALAQKSFADRFGWSHLKQADTRAVYPFEDQMKPYEENDRVLLFTVRDRDKGTIGLSQKDLDNINTHSPDLKK